MAVRAFAALMVLSAGCPERHPSPAMLGEDAGSRVDSAPGADASRPPDASLPSDAPPCGEACEPRLLVILSGANGFDLSYPTMGPARFGIRYQSACAATDESVGDVLAIDAPGVYVLDATVDPRFPMLVDCMTDAASQEFCLMSGPDDGIMGGTCFPESAYLGNPDLWQYVITELRLHVTSLTFAPGYHAEAEWRIWGYPKP